MHRPNRELKPNFVSHINVEKSSTTQNHAIFVLHPLEWFYSAHLQPDIQCLEYPYESQVHEYVQATTYCYRQTKSKHLTHVVWHSLALQLMLHHFEL